MICTHNMNIPWQSKPPTFSPSLHVEARNDGILEFTVATNISTLKFPDTMTSPISKPTTDIDRTLNYSEVFTNLLKP